MARESTIGSIFYLETLPASAAVDVTALTAGATTLVTTALTAAIGDFIVLRNTGSKILDRLTMHRVSATGVGTLTIDTDTTGETFDVTAETEAYKVGIQEVCFSEFGLDAPAPTEVDVTTMYKDFRLVRPKRQVRHRDACGQVRYTDAEWELSSGGSLILEVDGSHHLDMSTYSDDLRRQRDLTERHVQLVRCSTWELRNEPDQLAATLIRLGVPRTAY